MVAPAARAPIDVSPYPVSGRFRLDVFRRGDLVEQVDEPNLVVINARLIMAGLLGGLATPIAQIAYGTSNVAPALGNTTITAPFAKALDGVSYPSPGIVQFAFSLASGEANGMSIGEFGLLATGGLLFARKARFAPPIPKDSTISLTGTWLISCAGPAT